MGRFIFLVITILTLAAAHVNADGDRPAELECRSAGTAITLDGSLDEQAWFDADWRGDFRQSSPHYNQPASENTYVAFLRDGQFLYIAVRNACRNPAGIVATRLRHRDNPWKDDFVQVIIDTYQDQTRGYIFTVNPLGAREEGQVNGERHYDWDWNDVWDAEASITPDAWLSVAGLFQYNSSSGVASANIRLRLIHGDDSDLFIVFNERQRHEFDRWITEGRQAVIKINYRLFL